jgi:hypothetical protein
MNDEPVAATSTGEKIFYVDWGIGNRTDAGIYLNKNLLKPRWKQLHDYVLQHEKDHVLGLTMFGELRLDFWLPIKIYLLSWLFMLLNPGALWQLSPIRIYKHPETGEKTIGTDITTFFSWIVIIIAILLISAGVNSLWAYLAGS